MKTECQAGWGTFGMVQPHKQYSQPPGLESTVPPGKMYNTK